MKSALYLIIFCCTSTQWMAHFLAAAESDPQTSVSPGLSPTLDTTLSSPLQSFLETTHYFECFELGYKRPWQKRLLQNKTGEQRKTLESMIDTLAKDIVSDEAFKESVNRVYSKKFTAVELKTLDEFYRSGTGAKIINSQLTNTPMTPSPSDQQVLNDFGETALGRSLNERMAEINVELQQLTAPVIEKHQGEFFPKFRQLDH